MSKTVIVVMVLVSLLSLNHGWAQPDRLDVEAIRKSIQQLQSQLDQITKEPADQRVTNLGKQAPDQPVRPPNDETLVLRYYDLSDLFGVAPSYPSRLPRDFEESGGLTFESSRETYGGGGGGGAFSIPETSVSEPLAPPNASAQDVGPAASVTLTSLVDVIQSVIAPQQWEKNHWSIAELGVGILVNASESTQQQIENMLRLFRQRWGSLRMVFVQAYWVRCDLPSMGELLSGKEVKDVQSEKGVGVIPAPAGRSS